MSKTAFAWIFAYCGGLVFSFWGPFYGLLAYLLDYYAHPPLHWWGKGLPDLRWSLLAAVVLLLTYLFNGYSLFDTMIVRHPQTKWLVCFLIVALSVTPFAVSVDRSVHYLKDIAKLTLLYFLIVGTVRTPKEFRWFVLVMILGGLLWGVDAFIDPTRRGGRLYGIGGPDSDSDNSAAAHLVTALPFIGIIFLIGNLRERAICLAAAPFVLNTLVLCNSRGATVAIGAAIVAGLFLAKGRLRFQFVGMGLLAGVLFLFLVDKTFIERQWTIVDYEQDGSATGRIESWKGALRLIRDHPLGTGGGGFDILSPVYIPEIVAAHGGEERAVHNTYLWVGSDWGIAGLICFMGFILSTLFELHAIRKQTISRRIYYESFAIEVALVGFLTAAFFINRPYAEILYWLAGLTAALRNIQEKDDGNAEPVADGESFPIERDHLAWSRG